MPDNFNVAMEKTANAFQDICAPELKKILPYTFISIEKDTSVEALRMLDIEAGLDVLVNLHDEGVVRGMASRIQPDYKNWKTFTVRKERSSGARTEYEKKRAALNNDGLHPFYTMQAYTINGKLEGMAICHTKELFRLIHIGCCTELPTGKDQIGQAWFYIVNWSDFNKDSIKIFGQDTGWIE
jgi:hypothetical protein